MKKLLPYKNKSLDDMEGEIWREIPFTEGYYVVSNMGRVKRLERMIYTSHAPNGQILKEKILTPGFSRHYNKYTKDYIFELRIKYSFEKTRFSVYTKDGNGFNCMVENLALVTWSTLRKRVFQNNRGQSSFQLMSSEARAAMDKKIGLSKRKKICKYSIDGELLATYSSLTVAAKKNKLSIGCVGLCAQKKIKILKGVVFRYSDDVYAGELKDWDRNGRLPVVKYSLGGKKLKVYGSIKEASETENINPSNIASCAHKRYRHAGGYVWRFKGEGYGGEYKDILKKRKCIQLSTDGEIIRVFKSLAQAVAKTGADFSGIKRVMEGQRNTCNGFAWKWG